MTGLSLRSLRHDPLFTYCYNSKVLSLPFTPEGNVSNWREHWNSEEEVTQLVVTHLPLGTPDGQGSQ